MNNIRLREVDIKNDSMISFKALLKKVTILLTKKNQEYYTLEFVDKTISLEVKKWSITQEDKETLIKGKVYSVLVSREEFQGNNSYILKDKAVVEEDSVDYLVVEETLKSNLKTIDSAVKALKKNTVYEIIVSDLVERYKKDIECYPAAISYHHVKIGGWAKHIADMLKTARSLYEVYPNIDWELLFSGIILHDIGKFKEYAFDRETGTVEFTKQGTLIGHINMGVCLIHETALKYGLQDELEVDLLKHLVISHHGKQEYGSPVTPKFTEAILLSSLDGMDSSTNRAILFTENEEKDTIVFKKNEYYYVK